MVSVCMAVFNGEKFIEQQIETILTQLDQCDELIISDDASSDNTLSKINSFSDRRIKLYQHTPVGRTGRERCINNFEFCLVKAKGDYVYLADQDDIWMPDKIKVCNQLLVEFDFVASTMLYIDEHNIILEDEINMGETKVYRGLFRNLIKNSYTGACVCFKRQVLQKALPFPSKIPLQDQWIGIVAEAFYKVKIVNQPLVLHRIHSHNLSTTGLKSQYSILKKMLFRWYLLRGIIIKCLA